MHLCVQPILSLADSGYVVQLIKNFCWLCSTATITIFPLANCKTWCVRACACMCTCLNVFVCEYSVSPALQVPGVYVQQWDVHQRWLEVRRRV